MPAASSLDPRIFLLDTNPTILDKGFKISNLPNDKEILLNFLAYHDDLLEDGKGTLRKASKKTSDIVAPLTILALLEFTLRT